MSKLLLSDVKEKDCVTHQKMKYPSIVLSGYIATSIMVWVYGTLTDGRERFTGVPWNDLAEYFKLY